MAAATSTDGGQTWGNLVPLVTHETKGAQFSTDKNSITARPTRAGVAYSVWDTFVSPTDVPDANPHATVPLAYTGPAYFSLTTDKGVSWSTPTVIFDTASHQQTIGNIILVDPRGDGNTLYDFFDWITAPNSFGNPGNANNYQAAFVKSTDGRKTWTQPQVISRIRTTYVSDARTGAGIRTGDIIPEAVIDPANGYLYVVWQDSRFNSKNANFGTYDEVAFSMSKDGGATWSAPKRISTPTGEPAFTPSVRVNSSGVVAVTYYDFRNLSATTPANSLPTDLWVTTSKDFGATFGGGYFVGGYEGLSSFGTLFRPFWVQTASPGHPTIGATDAFTTSVAP